VNDYFVVHNNSEIVIVHPQPAREGIVSNVTASDGRLLSTVYHEMAISKGEGFANYEFPKPGAAMDKPSPKLSYIQWFAPWKWVVSTGVYVDDISAQIWHRIYVSTAIGLAFLLAIGGLAGVVMLGLSRRLKNLSNAMVRLAQGESDIDLPAEMSDDEIGRMAQAVQVFKDAALEKIRLEAQADGANRSAEEGRAARETEKAAEAQLLQFAIEQLGEGMQRLAGGDLAYRIDTPFEAKVDKLRADFNRAVDKLQETMVTISGNTQSMSAGTEQISKAADDMSRRTE
jgi:methyl-accepting chemotaxis protein